MSDRLARLPPAGRREGPHHTEPVLLRHVALADGDQPAEAPLDGQDVIVKQRAVVDRDNRLPIERTTLSTSVATRLHPSLLDQESITDKINPMTLDVVDETLSTRSGGRHGLTLTTVRLACGKWIFQADGRRRMTTRPRLPIAPLLCVLILGAPLGTHAFDLLRSDEPTIADI